MNQGAILLIASSQSNFAQILSGVLNEGQRAIIRCFTFEEARVALAKFPVQIVLCEDRALLGQLSDLARIVSDVRHSAPIILFSGVLALPGYLGLFEFMEENSPSSRAKPRLHQSERLVQSGNNAV